MKIHKKNQKFLFWILISCKVLAQSSPLQQEQLRSLEEKLKNRQNKEILQPQATDQTLIDYQRPREVELNIYEQIELVDSTNLELRFFGYEFFTRRDSIAFWENLPTPSNYLIGDGDEIIISLWGETQIRQSYIISREGNIYDEKVGLLSVSGLNIQEAEKFLKNQFGRVYETINGTNPKTFFNLSLGRLRSINVNFVGEVKYPGLHLIHPFSNLITGLIQVGGVDTTGSLRNIQLKRNNKNIATIDLYDYLLKGNNKNNIQMRDGDVVVVPTRTKTATIKTGTIRPLIYEFKKGESVDDLIEIAGGLVPKASSKIGIERIIPFESRSQNKIAMENYYFDIGNSSQILLQNGDIISILQILESTSYVEIIGQVKKPGKYFFNEGMSVKDLINLSGGFNDTTFSKSVYKKSAQIVRKDPDSRFETVIKINLNDLINNKAASNLVLENLDRLIIHPNLNYYERENVIIDGQVRIPGSYTIMSDNETLDSMINRAGGLTPSAHKNGISIFRLDKYFDLVEDNQTQNLTYIKNGRIKLAWEDGDVKLMPGDSIIVKESPMTVIVSGKVYNPGLVEFVSGRNLNNYIDLAGGVTTDGDKRNIIIVYSNGVVKPKKWYNSPKIDDGSQIIVNPKPEQEPFNITQFATNWTSIISSMITAVILSRQLGS